MYSGIVIFLTIAQSSFLIYLFFFFNDTATTEIYTLSLHDALPISRGGPRRSTRPAPACRRARPRRRSEEHTSELQSPCNLVCRLLLEKKKKKSATSILYTALRRWSWPPAAIAPNVYNFHTVYSTVY